MPEGHTIHRLARDLNTSLRDETVAASSPQGRFEAGARRLDGQRCVGFEAYGKHLIGHFGDGDVLHVHLGLIGKFKKSTKDPVGAVRLRLSPTGATPEHHWDLRGPMVCTLGTPELADEVAAKVGPDPLDRAADVDRFVENLRRRRIAIGAALLDQKVVAGIGNVYRAELLFLAGIDPEVPANALDESDVRAIWKLAVDQLRQGEKLNRIVTVDPAELGYRTPRQLRKGERLYVYKREGEPCRVCHDTIELLDVAGRKMWRCPSCQ